MIYSAHTQYERMYDMENKASNFLWGALLIVAGVILGGNFMGFWEFDIFFDGWWTLFIIIPCAISIITGGSNFGNIFGLLVGVALLVHMQGFFDFDLFFDGWWTLFIIVPCIASIIKSGVNVGNVIGVFIGAALLVDAQFDLPFNFGWSMILPFILVVVGISVMFGNSARRSQNVTHINSEGVLRHTAIFSSYDTVFKDEEFYGADIFCLFGGVEMDLRDAIVRDDISLKSTTIFGGADIFVPRNVNVEVVSTPIFGGVSNDVEKRQKDPDQPTIFINCTCIFGGVDLK